MKRLFSIRDFCDIAGVARSTAYRENKAGRLLFVKVGKATRIPKDAVEQWLASLPTANAR